MGFLRKRIHIYLMEISSTEDHFLWRSFSHCLHLSACVHQVNTLYLLASLSDFSFFSDTSIIFKSLQLISAIIYFLALISMMSVGDHCLYPTWRSMYISSFLNSCLYSWHNCCYITNCKFLFIFRKYVSSVLYISELFLRFRGGLHICV